MNSDYILLLRNYRTTQSDRHQWIVVKIVLIIYGSYRKNKYANGTRSFTIFRSINGFKIYMNIFMIARMKMTVVQLT